MNLGVAALVAWLLTALLGAALVLIWAARSSTRPLRRRSRPSLGRPPPYIPRPLVAAHVLLALAGLAAWAAALTLLAELAWPALGALVLVTALGAGMFVRWIGSRRARRAVWTPGGAPAESRLPALVVFCHGLMGFATVLLVVLSWLRPG